MKLDFYKVVFNPEKPGVFNLSFVKKPAIESALIALSEEDNVIELTTIDVDKRLVLGAVLIPDKPIFRNKDGYKFNIGFDKETIVLAAQHFLINNNQKNTSIEHNKIALSDNCVVESWIKEDAEKDKSLIYGIDEPVGTWFVVMRVDDEDTLEKIKNKEVTGFSIEGLFDLEQIELNQHKTDEMKTEDIIKGITAFLENKLPAFISLGKATTEDGEVTFNFEGDTLEAGKTAITMTGADNEELPVPDGTYRVTIDSKPTDLEVKDSIVQTITAVEEAPATPPAAAAPVAMGDEAAVQAAKIASQKETRETIFALSKVIGDSVSKAVEGVEKKYDDLLKEKDNQIIALTKGKGETLDPSKMSAYQLKKAREAGQIQ